MGVTPMHGGVVADVSLVRLASLPMQHLVCLGCCCWCNARQVAVVVVAADVVLGMLVMLLV